MRRIFHGSCSHQSALASGPRRLQRVKKQVDLAHDIVALGLHRRLVLDVLTLGHLPSNQLLGVLDGEVQLVPHSTVQLLQLLNLQTQVQRPRVTFMLVQTGSADLVSACAEHGAGVAHLETASMMALRQLLQHSTRVLDTAHDLLVTQCPGPDKFSSEP